MKSFFLSVVFGILQCLAYSQVSINTDGTQPDNSAMLDVKSSERGFLPPRMTQSQRNNILNPAIGLIIYQTDNISGYYFNSGTSVSPVWKMIGGDTGWSISGNTLGGSEFIGSVNNQAMKFFTNNLERLRISATGKVGIGTTAPQWYLDVAGSMNLALDSVYRIHGYQVLSIKGTGNTFTGMDAGKQNTYGNSNTATGEKTLFSNLTGNQNTAVGFNALYNNTHGNYNTAIGVDALYSNLAAYYNTALGYQAMRSNTTGTENSAMGYGALRCNTVGANNTATGMNSLYFNTTGNNNTGNGAYVLYFNTTGFHNTAIGCNALRFNTSGAQNIANGYQALFSNTTGNSNTATGVNALFTNTTGNFNTANGLGALFYNITGSENIAIGYQSLYTNTTGYSNIADGIKALYSNTTGNLNTANGYQALFSNTIGSGNVANGYKTLYINTIGNFNTALGKEALITNTEGSNNTAIGSGANVSAGNLTNATVIGANALVAQSNSLVLGNNVNVGIGTPQPSEKLHISGGNLYVENLPGSSTAVIIGNRNTGSTNLAISTSAYSDGYINLQAVSKENSSWGDLILNPNGGDVSCGGSFLWSNSALINDQGGSIELGAKNGFSPGTPFIDFHHSGGSPDYNVRIINDDNGRLSFFAQKVYATGNVGIGVTNPTAKLEVAGHTKTQVLEITGGSDLAEPFEISSDEALPVGTVVVIDHENPGKLTQSTKAYDKRVAGAISGAGGVRPGLTLTQEGDFKDGQHVALSGKVYVLATAANGAIEPGDRLTTSKIPGHAMKATNEALCGGSVIGKAMSSLEKGEGLVLVLLNLQ